LKKYVTRILQDSKSLSPNLAQCT